MTAIRLVLSDVGGVLLTNGWDRAARRRACLFFELDEADYEERHAHYYGPHELGRITLEEYLRGALFYRKRPFSAAEFIEFMRQQSRPLPGMLELLRHVKEKSAVLWYALSNEGAELAGYRAHKFHLDRLFDAYLVSSYVNMRKPDPAFYRLAMSLAQAAPQQVLYLDDRSPLVDAAAALGIQAYRHSDPDTTAALLTEKLALR